MGATKPFDAVVPNTGEVVAFENGRPVLPGRATDTGLDLPSGLTFEEWSGIGSALQGAQRSMMWWIGDWYVYGEENFGEEAAQAVEEHGYSPESVRYAVRVSSRIPTGKRFPELSWVHHQEAAKLDGLEERCEVLRQAADEGMTTRQLRAEVRRRKGLPEPSPRSAPDPEPAPLDGPMRETVMKLDCWLVEGRRMVATFKSGQVAAVRCRENGMNLDPDRIDALVEFLSVLYHTLTAEEQAERAA